MTHEKVSDFDDDVLNSAQMGSAPKHIADHGLENIVNTLFAESDRAVHEILRRISAAAKIGENSLRGVETVPVKDLP